MAQKKSSAKGSVSRGTTRTKKTVKQSFITRNITYLVFMLVFGLIGVITLVLTRASNLYTIPNTIAADCSADVTQPILSWIATVPDDSTIQFGVGKCYHIENTLFIANRHKLTIDGQGSEFRALTDGSGVPAYDGKEANWPRHRAHWQFASTTSDIVIRNMTVRGNNTNFTYNASLEAQHAFGVGGARNIIIEDVKVFNVWGDFVSVGSGAKNVTVRRGEFSGAGRQGFSVTQGEDVIFENFSITRVGRSAVDIEPLQSSVVKRVVVRNGVFQAPINFHIFANGGTGGGVEDIWVENNQVRGKNWSAVVEVLNGSLRQRYTFLNNTSDTSTNHPPSYSFKNIQHAVVKGATQTYVGKLDAAAVGIEFLNSCGIAEGNTFPGLTTTVAAPTCATRTDNQNPAPVSPPPPTTPPTKGNPNPGGGTKPPRQ